VIVWAVFRENYERIRKVCHKLKAGYVELHGDVAEGKRQENIHKFNNDDEVRVLIGHPGSGGIGVNLIAASYAVFYSRTFSLEHSVQAEARNYRGGSDIHESVTRIDLCCEGTIDEDVQKKLADKMEIGEAVLRQIALERKHK
jgi:SNF2 family DNA or RNA helicase